LYYSTEHGAKEAGLIFDPHDPIDQTEVLESLKKLLGDIEYLSSNEDTVEDVVSVLRLDRDRYTRALREAIRLFGIGEPVEEINNKDAQRLKALDELAAQDQDLKMGY
jgi:hypothetical protein